MPGRLSPRSVIMDDVLRDWDLISFQGCYR